MRRMTIAALTLLTISAIAYGESFDLLLAGPKVQLSAYESCVVGYAKSFAGSPESSETIIRRATGECVSARRALSEALVAAGARSDVLTELFNGIDKRVAQEASRAVAEERASH